MRGNPTDKTKSSRASRRIRSSYRSRQCTPVCPQILVQSPTCLASANYTTAPSTLQPSARPTNCRASSPVSTAQPKHQAHSSPVHDQRMVEHQAQSAQHSPSTKHTPAQCTTNVLSSIKPSQHSTAQAPSTLQPSVRPRYYLASSPVSTVQPKHQAPSAKHTPALRKAEKLASSSSEAAAFFSSLTFDSCVLRVDDAFRNQR